MACDEIGYALSAVDIISDAVFAGDAYTIIHSITETYKYGQKIYSDSQIEGLQAARNAAIVFAVLGALMSCGTCCYYLAKKPNGRDQKKDALNTYNGWTFTVIDVPMLIIVFYFSFETGTVRASAMFSVVCDLLVWLWKGYAILKAYGLFDKYHLATFFETFSASINFCGTLVIGIALLILGYAHNQDSGEGMDFFSSFAIWMGWIFLAVFIVAIILGVCGCVCDRNQ